MTGRYDQSDLNVYGAEDDDDLDMILDALDEAIEPSAESAVGRPTGADWNWLLNAPVYRVRDLDRSELPDQPGVYLWRRHGTISYVGMAKNLRVRIWSKHLGGGVSLASSSLRRNVCESLFDVPTTLTSNPTRMKVTEKQADAIREWLRDCDVSWLALESEAAAAMFENRLGKAFLPQLNRF